MNYTEWTLITRLCSAETGHYEQQYVRIYYPLYLIEQQMDLGIFWNHFLRIKTFLGFFYMYQTTNSLLLLTTFLESI